MANMNDGNVAGNAGNHTMTDMPGGVIAAKVKAATAGAVTAGFVLWLLAQYVFDGNDIPAPVEAFVTMLVLGASAFASGYLKFRSPKELR